jgi:hypothetical protein
MSIKSNPFFSQLKIYLSNNILKDVAWLYGFKPFKL